MYCKGACMEDGQCHSKKCQEMPTVWSVDSATPRANEGQDPMKAVKSNICVGQNITNNHYYKHKLKD